MAKDIKERLTKGIIVADGAMGSELMNHGLQAGESPILWNAEKPDVLKSIHQSYIDAGARFILTNTFGGNLLKMEADGTADRLEELNRAAAENCIAVAGDDVFAVGDIGPTGQFLEPVGTCTESDFVKAFEVQAQALASGGVDAFLIETMSDPNEVAAAVKGIRNASDLPIGVSMSFDQTPGTEEYRTMMGVTVRQFVDAANTWNVDIIGTNCGKGAHETVNVARIISENTDAFTLAFPNAGVPRIKNGETVYDQTPEVMEPYYREMIEMGINILGGCCGTTPEHIQLLSKLI